MIMKMAKYHKLDLCNIRPILHLGCGPEDVSIAYSDQYNSDTSAEKLLTVEDGEVWDGANTNYWILPNYSTGILILNFACKQKFSRIRLGNTHNAEHKTRATKKFRNILPDCLLQI